MSNKLSSASTTDMTNTLTEFSVNNENTSINEYTCNWTKWYGYYKSISAFSSLIDKKAIWTIGKGFEADEPTRKILENIKGFGKDTFDTIMSNGNKTKTICGDFFAEIIRNGRGKLINLKPLNPSQWKIVASDKGVIKYYEQISAESVNGKTERLQKLKPDEMFHLCHNRTADDIHGVGATERIEDTLKKYQEAMNDMQIVFHRYVKPLLISEVDSDDPAEIAAYKAKLDNAVANGENMIIPKDTATVERVSIPQYSTLDPLPWIKHLENDFYKAEGVPAVAQAVSVGSTEAEAKIIYLAWQQIIEWEQLYLEQQIKAQLGLEVKYNFPASIAPDIIGNDAKSSDMAKSTQESGAGKK